MSNRIRRILLLAAGIVSALLLWACNTQTPAIETELKFFNPNPFGSEVDSVKVAVKYGGKEIQLFEGRIGKPGFGGPWSAVVTDYNGEPLDLNILTFGADKVRLNDFTITYKEVGGRLTTDSSVFFEQKAIAVNLKDSLLILKWVVLPVNNASVPIATSSKPGILSILDNKTAKLHDTGKVKVIIRLDSPYFADTLDVQVYSGADIPDPVSPESIRMVTDSVKLVVGISGYPLVWTIIPRQFTGSVTCETDSPAIIRVTGNSGITPLMSGQAKVICSIDGTALADTLTVTIPAADPGIVVDSIRFALRSLTLYVGGEPVKPVYSIHPPTAKPVLAWSISTGIAKLDSNGALTPVAAGTAWVSVFAAGAGVVKDSLELKVVDTSRTANARWSADTLRASVNEGSGLSINLVDSILDPASGLFEIVKGRISAKSTLAANKYAFKAGIRDSGDYFDLLIVKQAGFADSVIVHIKVNPVHVTLTLLTAANGTFAAVPTKPKYRLGDTVTVTATPAAGYGFSSWTGAGASTSNPLALIMDSDKSIKADFQPLAVLGCVEVAAGESLNANLVKIYASVAGKGTLCPAQGAKFDMGTIQVIGKVQFLIR